MDAMTRTAPPAATPPWALAWASLRVRQWWYFALLTMAAVAVSPQGVEAWRLAVAFLAGASSLAFAFGVNAVSDRGDDHDTGKNPLVPVAAVPGAVHVAVWGTALASLALAAWLGPWTLWAAVVSVVAGAVYSLGPRLKARPWAGTICNAVIFAPLLAFGVEPGARLDHLVALAVVFVVLLTQNQLLHEVADMPEDVPAGVRTTGALLGATGAYRLAAALGLVGAVVVVGTLGGTAVSVAAVAALLVGSGASAWADVDRPAVARVRHRMVAAVAGASLFAVVASSAGVLGG